MCSFGQSQGAGIQRTPPEVQWNARKADGLSARGVLTGLDHGRKLHAVHTELLGVMNKFHLFP